MAKIKEISCCLLGAIFGSRVSLTGKTNTSLKRFFLFLLVFFALTGVVNAQIEFPAGDFWSLDAGFGMSGILVEGTSYQFILDPKLWLSPPLMIGSKLGINYSTDKILTFEGQVYLRWNFLRLGKNPEKKTNIFVQGGLGLLAAYRGNSENTSPFADVTRTRGSLLADAAVGVTIPLSARWHIEPSVRGGYPHIFGAAITAGYKFPLPQKTKYQELPPVTEYEYIEVIKTLPSSEIIKHIMIAAVEFILFGPNIGTYNVGIDRDASGLNELTLNHTAQMLIDNPNYRVRIEGHANPITTDPNEADELMTLSSIRAHAIADQLKAKGVSEDQMVIISYGGTRTVTSSQDIWNRNRRVEMIIVHVDSDSN